MRYLIVLLLVSGCMSTPEQPNANTLDLFYESLCTYTGGEYQKVPWPEDVCPLESRRPGPE